jgi:hypothetical protein
MNDDLCRPMRATTAVNRRADFMMGAMNFMCARAERTWYFENFLEMVGR